MSDKGQQPAHDAEDNLIRRFLGDIEIRDRSRQEMGAVGPWHTINKNGEEVVLNYISFCIASRHLMPLLCQASEHLRRCLSVGKKIYWRKRPEVTRHGDNYRIFYRLVCEGETPMKFRKQEGEKVKAWLPGHAYTGCRHDEIGIIKRDYDTMTAYVFCKYCGYEFDATFEHLEDYRGHEGLNAD